MDISLTLSITTKCDQIFSNGCFFVTYEWAQYARVFTNSSMEWIAKHCSLLEPFLSYEENEVL